MQFKPLQLIFQTISEKIDNLDNETIKSSLNQSTKSVIASILANLISGSETIENTKEMAEKWSENIIKCLQDSKNLNIISEMDNVDKGMYLSFIALGNKHAKDVHKEALIDFVTAEVSEDVISYDEHEFNIYEEDNSKSILKQRLKDKIKEWLSNLTDNEEFIDYFEEISFIGLFLKNRKKISRDLLVMLKLSIHHQLEISKTKLSKRSIATGIAAGLLGLGIGMLGGFALIDTLLPLSFGLSGVIIGKEMYKIQQINKDRVKKLKAGNLDINIDDFDKGEFSNILSQAKAQSRLKRLTRSDEFKNIQSQMQIQASVKGVFSNECNYSVSKVGNRDKAENIKGVDPGNVIRR